MILPEFFLSLEVVIFHHTDCESCTRNSVQKSFAGFKRVVRQLEIVLSVNTIDRYFYLLWLTHQFSLYYRYSDHKYSSCHTDDFGKDLYFSPVLKTLQIQK